MLNLFLFEFRHFGINGVLYVQVVEGEARGLQEGRHCKVIVKILREDATQTEQKFFLNEVKPYRDLNHQNVLKLVGRCLETNPYLILLEACNSVSCLYEAQYIREINILDTLFILSNKLSNEITTFFLF